MSEKELKDNIIEQLNHEFIKKSHISKEHKNYCVRMLMDFMPSIKKSEAVEIMQNQILPELSLYSGEFNGVKYLNDGASIWLEVAEQRIKINIYKDNLIPLGKELIKLGMSFKALDG